MHDMGVSDTYGIALLRANMHNRAMSLSHQHEDRLSFDMADRMRRALRVSDISVNDMAEALQVSRNTVTSWINGRNRPRRRDLVAFAMRTGFPIGWLETGEAPPEGGAPDDGECTPRDLNPEPTDYRSGRRTSLVRLGRLVAA